MPLDRREVVLELSDDLSDVRHTHATHLLTESVPVHIVAARLGHSSPMVTLTVYAHVLPTSDEKAASVVAALLA